MRILIAGRGFDAPGRQEVGVFELDQARALRDAGHDVRFAAVDTRSIRRPRPLGSREYELHGIPVYYCALPAGARPAGLADLAQRSASRRIWKQMEQDGWRPDLVHAHFGSSLLREARRHGIPTVYTEHSSLANQESVPDSEFHREKDAYALADRVICVSRPLADRIALRHGVDPTVVHNIVDAAFFSFAPAPCRADGVFRFVAAGSLIRRKGYDLLLEALAALSEKGNSGVTLTIIGEGEARASLTALAQSLGLRERVTFTGQLDRAAMVNHYRESDAFVLASRRETFGVVCIEAMAMGLPVIATTCGGPEDYISAADGILVPTENARSLASAMENMIRGIDDYDRSAIARRARESFSPQTIAAELTDVYKEVIGC